VYEDLGDDRLNFSPATISDVVVSGQTPNAQLMGNTTNGESFYPATATIRGQYSIAAATTMVNGHQKTYHTIVNVAHSSNKQQQQSNNQQKIFNN
jgi:hypothetical protein